MDVSLSKLFYGWAISAIVLIVFKFIVDRALSIRTAFARIKYVYSIHNVVSILAR